MMHVLIVDDDPEICFFFETVLKKMGGEFSTANSIRTAEEQNQRWAFDLVLLDLELPDGNGLDIMPSLSEAPSSPEIKLYLENFLKRKLH